ncbi:MAG: hypothetical protein ABW046_07140 [Actinoplanes sp.]
MSVNPRDLVGALLPESWSQKDRDNLADEILDALAFNGLLTEGEIETVGIRWTHVPIETVEAYGLVIGVDANGYAAEISSAAQWPLEVVA